MQLAALSLAGTDLSSTAGYINDLKKILSINKPKLAVLPAYSALALGLGAGRLKPGPSFPDILSSYLREGDPWNKEYLNLHGQLSAELQIYLAAGSLFEHDNGHIYHTAYCFDPAGSICFKQRQTHLTRFERHLQLSRGGQLELFQVGDFLTGLVVGNDARHPEVGRILALQGADLLLCSGVLEGDLTCWQQTAGLWAQVQQNQVFAVEAQLFAEIAGLKFGGTLAVMAPCEITAGQTGFINRGAPGLPLLSAEIELDTLVQIRREYPLLKLLNPEAYDSLYGEKSE